MKALDTPILLEILRGRTKARALLASLAGEELATTEVNMLELAMLAHADGPKGLERRLGALERLRRRLTVLAIDERATRAAAALARSGPKAAPTGLLLMLGAVESAGCSEWITVRGATGATVPGKVKVRVLGE